MAKLKKFIIENKMLFFYLFLLLILALISFFPQLFALNDPYEAVMQNSLMPPSPGYPLGTDRLGRCLYSRIIYGMRVSVSLALLLVLLIFTVGTLLGVIAGYYGGIADMIISRLSDTMASFPGVVLAIAIAGIMGANMIFSVFALAVIHWTKYAKLARSLVLNIKKNDYITAAVVTGTKKSRILKNYIVPNMIPTMIVTAVMDIGVMMLELAGLSFLGFGAQPPTPEWGLMLNEGRQHMQTSPWLMIYPGIAIIITVIIFNLAGDSLRDLLDPDYKTKNTI